MRALMRKEKKKRCVTTLQEKERIKMGQGGRKVGQLPLSFRKKTGGKGGNGWGNVLKGMWGEGENDWCGVRGVGLLGGTGRWGEG